MKKIYKTYVIQKRKNNKCVIFGMDEKYKAFKVLECESEEKAEMLQKSFQRKATIYYELHNQISNVVSNYRARVNSADIIALDFDSIVDKILKEYQANLIRKRILVSNITNETNNLSSLSAK